MRFPILYKSVTPLKDTVKTMKTHVYLSESMHNSAQTLQIKSYGSLLAESYQILFVRILSCYFYKKYTQDG